MSEGNILNPTATSLLNPNFGYETERLPTLEEVLAASGKWFGRHAAQRGRVYSLGWARRDKATMHALLQWAEQYRHGFFTFWDYERARGFSGRFEGELVASPQGNESWDVRGRFVELPTLAMQTYPTNWTRDAAFLEERNDFGEDLLKLTGAGWAYDVTSSAHGGAQYINAGTDAAQFAEWQYFGYGFRLWAFKAAALGILEASATKVRDGSVALAATNVDLYNATTLPSAALLTKADLPLDLYRVKIKATNTKNASATDFFIYADAIEVMR